MNALPRNARVEEIQKTDIKDALEKATRNTTKGKYHKIVHASGLLPLLNPQTVRSISSYCDKLLNILEQPPL